MKISKIHQNFADNLNTHRALSHPEEFLGPNWKEVLNFWIYLDNLSDEQLDIAEDRFNEAPLDDLDIVDIVDNAAWETFDVCSVGVGVSPYVIASSINCDLDRADYKTTLELIGAHKILEQGKPLVLVPLWLDL
jgi:hypothetical protein